MSRALRVWASILVVLLVTCDVPERLLFFWKSASCAVTSAEPSRSTSASARRRLSPARWLASRPKLLTRKSARPAIATARSCTTASIHRLATNGGMTSGVAAAALKLSAFAADRVRSPHAAPSSPPKMFMNAISLTPSASVKVLRCCQYVLPGCTSAVHAATS